MNHGISPGVIVALLIVALLIGGSYWIGRRQQGPRTQRRPPTPRRGAASQISIFVVVPSAHEMKARTARLLATNASWPQIVADLNPSNDADIQAELQRIRGPHMFAPATALNVIRHGCELALRSSSHASALSALRAAGDSMEKVTRYGD